MVLLLCAILIPAGEFTMGRSKLTPDDRAFIDQVLAETRMRRLVLQRVRAHVRAQPSGDGHAG